MSGAQTIAEGITEVQDEAEARATEEAQRAIEEAQRKTDEAEALARQLTDAALATELGRQISAVRTEVEQCRSQMTEQGSQLSALTVQLTELVARIPVLPEVPASTVPDTSIQPPLADTKSKAEPVNPDQTVARPSGSDAGDLPDQVRQSATNRRPRRLM